MMCLNVSVLQNVCLQKEKKLFLLNDIMHLQSSLVSLVGNLLLFLVLLDTWLEKWQDMLTLKCVEALHVFILCLHKLSLLQSLAVVSCLVLLLCNLSVAGCPLPEQANMHFLTDVQNVLRHFLTSCKPIINSMFKITQVS